MIREELFKMVELLRDAAKIHQPNEEILTDVKAESFIFIMDSVLSALSVPEREKGTDLISREAVIDLLNQFGYYDKEMERDLSAIPSAVPEREKGEWIEHKYAEEFCGRVVSNFECPFCHDWYLNKTNFCPNCGADMRGKAE